MVAALTEGVTLRRMTVEDLDTVLAIEVAAYAFPWTRAIFGDCLVAGYRAWVAQRGPMICGYGLLSTGAGEAHVLNLCVSLTERGVGTGRQLLAQLLADARSAGAGQVFLEVRPSNASAIRLYEAAGFHLISRRPGYYPAKNGREDALVMAMELLSEDPADTGP